jgi:hypothetical protein
MRILTIITFALVLLVPASSQAQERAQEPAPRWGFLWTPGAVLNKEKRPADQFGIKTPTFLTFGVDLDVARLIKNYEVKTGRVGAGIGIAYSFTLNTDLKRPDDRLILMFPAKVYLSDDGFAAVVGYGMTLNGPREGYVFTGVSIPINTGFRLRY